MKISNASGGGDEEVKYFPKILIFHYQNCIYNVYEKRIDQRMDCDEVWIVIQDGGRKDLQYLVFKFFIF